MENAAEMRVTQWPSRSWRGWWSRKWFLHVRVNQKPEKVGQLKSNEPHQRHLAFGRCWISIPTCADISAFEQCSRQRETENAASAVRRMATKPDLLIVRRWQWKQKNGGWKMAREWWKEEAAWPPSRSRVLMELFIRLSESSWIINGNIPLTLFQSTKTIVSIIQTKSKTLVYVVLCYKMESEPHHGTPWCTDVASYFC